jgi:hypothetical protein
MLAPRRSDGSTRARGGEHVDRSELLGGLSAVTVIVGSDGKRLEQGAERAERYSVSYLSQHVELERELMKECEGMKRKGAAGDDINIYERKGGWLSPGSRSP